jgi:hypothetical protein
VPNPKPITRPQPFDAPGRVPEDNQPGHHPEVEQDKPAGPPPRRSPGPPAERERPARRPADPERPARRPADPERPARRFGFRFEPLLVPVAAVVGVRPSTAAVEVGEREVVVRFGPWTMRFPRADVVSAEVTGPYHLLKIAGPPRLSLRDRGVTFATNREAGVCIRLRHPRPALDPLGLLRHPGLTVTVDDPEGLCELLSPG